MIQHGMRSWKLKVESWRLKVGNFLWSIESKTPEITGLTTEEVSTHRLSSTKEGSTTHRSIVPINNAFNPMFHRLKKTYANLELMWRIDDTWFLPLILEKLGYKITYDHEIINEYEQIIPQGINTSMNAQHSVTAYIPISTWCNQFCSYCIVPYARGLEKNFPVAQIVDEAKTHLKNGAKEIVLLGQIVNKHPDFVQILKEIVKLEGLHRLRYTSPYPTFYSRELLHLHEAEDKLCPHIHIPFQSGSDFILKKMCRGYTVAQAKKFIDDIRSLKRKISITTDIIVGFPGETEEDFQQTLDLVNYGKFDMIYIGIYSPRPGTLAQKKYPDEIPYKVKHERRSALNDLLNKISLENNQKEIWMIKEVLINNVEVWESGNVGTWRKNWHTPTPQHSNVSTYSGYTEDMKQILVQNVERRVQSGDFIKVKIVKAVPFKLYGEISP